MPEPRRFVADTNALVSRLLFRSSPPAQALRRAMSHHRLLVSSETLIELGEVLSRPKFDRYLPLTDRLEFFDRLRRLARHVPNVPSIVACHDHNNLPAPNPPFSRPFRSHPSPGRIGVNIYWSGQIS